MRLHLLIRRDGFVSFPCSVTSCLGLSFLASFCRARERMDQSRIQLQRDGAGAGGRIRTRWPFCASVSPSLCFCSSSGNVDVGAVLSPVSGIGSRVSVQTTQLQVQPSVFPVLLYVS